MQLIFGFWLVAATVVIHSVGIALLSRHLLADSESVAGRFWATTWLLVRITCGLLAVHVIEIALWAFFYLWHGCFPTAESAFYFSGVNVCHGGLRRPNTAARLAFVRPGRRALRHPDVRVVGSPHFCHCRLSSANFPRGISGLHQSAAWCNA